MAFTAYPLHVEGLQRPMNPHCQQHAIELRDVERQHLCEINESTQQRHSEQTSTSTCSQCSKEIEPLAGFRCTICQDSDRCQSCRCTGLIHKQATVNTAILQEPGFHIGGRIQHKKKHKKIDVPEAMQLLAHAVRCNGAGCSSGSCRKMRSLLEHPSSCQNGRNSTTCPHCRRLSILLSLHSKQCTRPDCPLSGCRASKPEDTRLETSSHYTTQTAMQSASYLQTSSANRSSLRHGSSRLGLMLPPKLATKYKMG